MKRIAFDMPQFAQYRLWDKQDKENPFDFEINR